MSRLALITYLDGRDVDPGYGQNAPAYPSQGLPGGPNYPSTGPIYGGGHPGHALPGGGHIALLPVFPFDPTRPDNSLPGSQPGVDNTLPGGGGTPDNTLPGSGGRPTQPIYPTPGGRYIVKWLACQGLILVPDNSLPPTAEPK